MDMEGIASPAISPDAKQIVFAREWVDQIKDQSRTNLWVYDLSTGRLRELTRGAWRDTAPVWSPDSKKLAFLSDRDGTNQIHTMFVDTGDVAQLTHLPRAASLAGLKWSPDSKTIAFSQMLPDEDPILKVELPKRPRGAEWAKGPTLVDRLSWARDGSGPVEKGYTHVFVDRRAGRRHAASAHRRQVQSRRAGMVGRWQDALHHGPAQARRGIPAG